MFMMLWITLLSCLATSTLAKIVQRAECPSVKAVTDFDAPRYMGTWYEAAKYAPREGPHEKCSTDIYSLNENGTITVRRTEINVFTDIEQTTTELAEFSGDKSEGKLMMEFPDDPSRLSNPHWIIATDYDNWALFFGCRRIGASSDQHVWVLTRARNPSQETMAAAYAAINRNNIRKISIHRIDQTNC